MTYDLGIIIPVFQSTNSVRSLVKQIKAAFLPDIKIRIYLVDDSGNSTVSSYLKKNCAFSEVTLFVLKENYGQQAAILCGLEHADPCRYYATMDDDLEQPVSALLALYQKILTGYDLIYAIPHHPDVPLFRRAGSQMRDLLFSRLLQVPDGILVSSLRIMTAQVVRDACLQKRNGFFYLSAAVFSPCVSEKKPLRCTNIYYKKCSRLEGSSGYNLGTLASLYKNIYYHYYLHPNALKNRNHFPVYRLQSVTHSRKLMVLGGSNCQINALKRTSQLGIDTVLIDYTENPPAAALAGLHIKASTFDTSACIEAAKSAKITGVMTLGTDQPVYTAAVVCKACSLPCLITEREALSVTNKRIMKLMLTDHKIPTVNYRFISKDSSPSALEGLRCPLVIKPLDSQGQRGIFKLDTPEEILSHLDQTLAFSKCKEALVEDYYESDEVTVSGWIKEGKLYVLAVTDRLLYPDAVHIGVCIGHRFPSVHMNRYDEIASLSQTVVTAFHLENGPFYLQLLIGKDGIAVNELASRIGGAFEDVFLPYLTGFDILQAVIDSALGKTVSVDCLLDYHAAHTDRCVALQLMFCHPGTIESITPLSQLEKLPYILDVGYNYKPGQLVPPMENATARFGHAVICGTKDTIDTAVEDFYSHIAVTSSLGKPMIKRLYPHFTERTCHVHPQL